MGICGQKVSVPKKKKLQILQNEYGGSSRIVQFNVSLFNFRGRNFKVRDSKFVISFGNHPKFTSKMVHNSINPSVVLTSSTTGSPSNTVVPCGPCANNSSAW